MPKSVHIWIRAVSSADTSYVHNCVHLIFANLSFINICMNERELDICRYTDYRKYLCDFYVSRKQINPNYSYRLFSRQAGISSPSHLKMIIDGTRNLSYKTIEKYTQALGLVGSEKKYFSSLVRYQQEKDLKKKAEYFQGILDERRKRPLSPLAIEKFNFLAKWHYVVIYVLVGTPEFQNNLEWIKNKIDKRVSLSNIKTAIEEMLKIGLIKYDDQMQLVQAEGALDTPEEIQHEANQQYHNNMISLALQYLESGDAHLREFNGATIPVNPKSLKLIKEKIRKFRTDVNQIASDENQANQVYQFNIQFFPLTN